MPDYDEIIVDEYGNDSSGYQEGLVVKSGDLQRIIADFESVCIEERKKLEKLQEGKDYFTAIGSLARLSSAFGSGAHIKFMKKYQWLDNQADIDEYLKGNPNLSHGEKLNVVAFEEMLNQTKDMRTGFAAHLAGDLVSTLKAAYEVILFEDKMEVWVTQDEIDQLIYAFEEFEDICDLYRHQSVIDRLGISPTESLREATEIVLQCMSMDILTKRCLPKYLAGSKSLNAGSVNRMYALDRLTEEFAAVMKKESDILEELDTFDEAAEYFQDICEQCDAPLSDYFGMYFDIADVIRQICWKAQDAIKKFKTDNGEAPYAIFHYDEDVSRVMNRIGVNVGDPLNDGTDYAFLFDRMISALGLEAQDIARKIVR